MGLPALKSRGGALSLAIAPGVGTLGTGTLWLAHAPLAVAIAGALGTVATAVVAIVKIRTDRSPEQVHAETQAVLAKKVKDPQAAMILMIVHALAANKQADVPALQASLVELLQQTPASPVAGNAELAPSAGTPDGCASEPASPDGQISDEQLQQILNEQPDSNADALTACY